MQNETDLKSLIPKSAFAFRGYNVDNLGRTPELLRTRCYRDVVRDKLREASTIASDVLDRNVDLVSRVENEQETDLESYADAIALVVAVEQAQLQLLREFHDVEFKLARNALGFSLGEISALVACDVFDMSQALVIPLTMAADGIELAKSVTLGVLFSHREELPFDTIVRECLKVNNRDQGVVGISTHLSPNSVLLMGTGDTLKLLQDRLKSQLTQRVFLRKNRHQWPPLHTPIVWKKNIPNRSSEMMHTLKGGFQKPTPPIISLVTGKQSYNDHNTREHLGKWIDHTQKLWDAVYEVLSIGIESVVHVGPSPNIIPATFERLAVDVEAQTRGSVHMRALSAVIRRPWISAMLPKRAALLRAPQLRQINLEDWLLDNVPD